jgi:dienelactone hydrolase
VFRHQGVPTKSIDVNDFIDVHEIVSSGENNKVNDVNKVQHPGNEPVTMMQKISIIGALFPMIVACVVAVAIGDTLRAKESTHPTVVEDIREQPLKDLDGYFPFEPPASMEAWQIRSERVRRRVLVSQGLWPMPSKTALNAVIHGRIEREEYVIDKVYFESAPGLFVTGNLYRPKGKTAAIPAVLFAHGHWQDARLSISPPERLRQEIATGEERFESGGQSRFQSLCVQLARMGCLVWQWDMLSDSDSHQIPREVIHKFAKQRPDMNTTENWGLFSPQAEAHLQSVMGLQTFNAVRSLDFVLSLPEVDPTRVAITGSSGGGTQTMLLAAIDPRIQLSFPVVMVSTSMQGGCTCENASLLRIGTGNVEFAALFAPKPQGMNTANDWTKEMATKGFPELQQLYRLAGSPKNVMLHRGEHFPHNYNAVTRSAFYTFLNRHFRLGQTEPVIERDFEPLTREQLTVWNEEHPAPKAIGPEFERSLLRWLHEDAEKQLHQALHDPSQRDAIIRRGIETVVGRTYEESGELAWRLLSETDRQAYRERKGVVVNKTHREAIPTICFHPKKWNGNLVIWLSEKGSDGLAENGNDLTEPVRMLIEKGTAVLGADLFHQRVSHESPGQPEQNRLVKNPREFAGYTYGYNHALFAQRVHDVMSLVRFSRTVGIERQDRPSTVALVAIDATGPIASVARSLLDENLSSSAINTHGFRFGQLLDYRSAAFLPGGAKYLDIPGYLALNPKSPIFLVGEEAIDESIAETLSKDSFISLKSEASWSVDDLQRSIVNWLR